MAVNPYTIDIGTGNLMRGFEALGAGLQNRGLMQQQEERMAEQEARLAAAGEVFNAGDPSAIADFMIANPDLAPILDQATGFRNDTTKAARRKGLQRIRMGEDPYAVINETVGAIEAAGGDASDTRALLDLTPDEIAGRVEEVQAAYFPEDWQQYRAFQQSKLPQPRETKVVGDTLLERNEQGEWKPVFMPSGQDAQVPPQLLEGLAPEVAEKASAAYSAAGGGKDGMKAFNAQVEIAEEEVLRQDIPQILDTSFPNASPAERAQLEATMQAAGTVEDGLKRAEAVRTEQRRVKKAQTFQDRAVTLLEGILDNDQLGDVIGSIEGAYDMRLFSDAESELIADIEEAQNILTAENMDLMTGVLSESDIKLLKNLSSGGLNRRRSEGRFKADVQQMLEKLKSQQVRTVDDEAMTLPEGVTEDDIRYTMQQHNLTREEVLSRIGGL